MLQDKIQKSLLVRNLCISDDIIEYKGYIMCVCIAHYTSAWRFSEKCRVSASVNVTHLAVFYEQRRKSVNIRFVRRAFLKYLSVNGNLCGMGF